MLGIIGHDGYILLGGKITQLGHQLRVQQFLVEDLSAAAVQDRTAVVRQDASAGLVQFQLFGQRGYAAGRPAGGQHQGHALGGSRLQGCPGAGGDLLFVVGQRAVQIQRQHLDL